MDFIVKPLQQFFDYIHNILANLGLSVGLGYTLTIIIFTIIIRMILLPLNIKQTKSQVAMNELQPEIKKLQEKHKNDPQKSQAEMMKLYKEKGVNPMGGCLPILVQLPILWSLFYVFRNIQPIDPVTGKELTEVGFLWLKNLFGTDNLHILPVLSAVTQYLSTIMIAPKGDSAQAKQMGTMNIAMSVMMIFFAWSMPAALVIYWVFNNLFQIAQTYFMKVAGLKKDLASSKE